MTIADQALPNVLPHPEWRAALEAFRDEEKAATRMLDALAARRRRLPMTPVRGDYAFEGPDGPTTLLDLFDGRRQLVVYHFMFAPDWDAGCIGCSMLADSFGELAHLHARDTSMAVVSLAPYPRLRAYAERMGWSFPWYSSQGSSFNVDLGATTANGEDHLLSTFLHVDDQAFLAYQARSRGVDRLNLVFNLLDMTPLGRQESWEDSPPGWPQTAPYAWWRRHDEYDR